MGFLDIFIIVVLIYSVFMGIKRGLVLIVLDVFALVASLFFAFMYYKKLSVYLSSLVNLSSFTLSIFSFCLIWILIFLGITLVNFVVDKIIKISILGLFNRIGGGVIGFAKGCIFLVPILMLMVYLNKPFVEKASLVHPFMPILERKVADLVPKIKKIKENNSFKNITLDEEDKAMSEQIQRIAEENNLNLQFLEGLENGERL